MAPIRCTRTLSSRLCIQVTPALAPPSNAGDLHESMHPAQKRSFRGSLVSPWHVSEVQHRNYADLPLLAAEPNGGLEASTHTAKRQPTLVSTRLEFARMTVP